MNAIFGTLSTEGLEESQDRIGGFRVHESGPYTGTIKLAYVGNAANSKARSVTIVLEGDAGGEYRETTWVTNKQDENFYLDKQDKTKKMPLPGFTTIDDLCLVTTNKGLIAQTFEEKTVNLYDYEAKKDVPTSVPMLVELLGKKVTLGLLKETKNKQVKNGNGVYEDTAESRDENTIDKIFHFPSNLTVVEARKGIQTPAFYGAWVEKNTGQTRDRRSIKDGAQGGQAGRPGGSPPKANGAAASTPSLFGS